MTCHDTRLFLNAWLDDELDVADALGLEQHVATCPDCQAVRREFEALRAAVRSPGVPFEAPPNLTQRLHRALVAAPVPGEPRHSAAWFRPVWIAVAALLLLSASSVLVYRGLRTSQGERLAAQVLAAHIRSLQPGHLIDVPSSDRHTVKPWFQGRLDYAPPVPDPPTEDWLLLGGRLDYLDNRPVGALVYAWRKHTVNAFVWPAAATEALTAETVRGYHLEHFTADGMAWWLVSDLNASDLAEFARHLQK